METGARGSGCMTRAIEAAGESFEQIFAGFYLKPSRLSIPAAYEKAVAAWRTKRVAARPPSLASMRRLVRRAGRDYIRSMRGIRQRASLRFNPPPVAEIAECLRLGMALEEQDQSGSDPQLRGGVRTHPQSSRTAPGMCRTSESAIPSSHRSFGGPRPE